MIARVCGAESTISVSCVRRCTARATEEVSSFTRRRSGDAPARLVRDAARGGEQLGGSNRALWSGSCNSTRLPRTKTQANPQSPWHAVPNAARAVQSGSRPISTGNRIRRHTGLPTGQFVGTAVRKAATGGPSFGNRANLTARRRPGAKKKKRERERGAHTHKKKKTQTSIPGPKRPVESLTAKNA